MDIRDIDIVEGRCRLCGESTEVLRLTEFNLKACRPCFMRFYERRVRRAIEKHDMIGEGDLVAVALSGGKDSTALLFALKRLGVVMGFELLGLHFHLNMEEYSDRNLEVVEEQARLAGIPLQTVRIGDMGLRVQRVKGWNPCAVCGVIKRSLLNRAAREMGTSVVATAHTLEDILLFTFKNILSRDFFSMRPALPPQDRLPRKVKPLFYMPERLNRAYCLIARVPFFEEKCPEWTPRGHSLKEVFEHLEEVMPSGKLQLLLSLQEALPAGDSGYSRPLADCPRCGEPSSQSPCALCQLSDWFSRPKAGTDMSEGSGPDFGPSLPPSKKSTK